MKKNKYRPEIIKFDNTDYYLPMLPSSNKMFDFKEDTVKAKIIQDGKGNIVVKSEGYQDKHFIDSYFQYLLDTNYIKRIK